VVSLGTQPEAAVPHSRDCIVYCLTAPNLRTDPDSLFDHIEDTLPALPIETKLTVTLREDAQALDGYIHTLVTAKKGNGTAWQELEALARVVGKGRKTFSETVMLRDAAAAALLNAEYR